MDQPVTPNISQGDGFGDIHICGGCKQQFTDVELFFSHKRETCPVLLSKAANKTAAQQKPFSGQLQDLGIASKLAVHAAAQPVVSAQQTSGFLDSGDGAQTHHQSNNFLPDGAHQQLGISLLIQGQEVASNDDVSQVNAFSDGHLSEGIHDKSTNQNEAQAASAEQEQSVLPSVCSSPLQTPNTNLATITNVDSMLLRQNTTQPSESHPAVTMVTTPIVKQIPVSRVTQIISNNESTTAVTETNSLGAVFGSVGTQTLPSVNMASIVGVQPRTVNLSPDVSLITADNLPSALQAALQSGSVQVLTTPASVTTVASPTKTGQTMSITKLVPKVRSPPAKKFHCPEVGCSFTTAYHKDLERHNRTHTGERPFGCHTCGRTFNRRDKLKIHLRGHTGNKPYKCQCCDYAAADSSSLKKHMRIHTDERPFKCQICPYASRNSSQLIVHLRTHTGDAPFQCQMCQAKFKINSDLKRHMRMHTGEKPYSCEFCDYKCAIKGNLKSHYKINHSTEKLLTCDQCPFQGSSKKALRDHIRSHEAEKLIKCYICDYACASRSALRAHLKIHSDERPYKCDYCSYTSRQNGNVRTHMNKKHGDKMKLRNKKSNPSQENEQYMQENNRRQDNSSSKRQKILPIVKKAFRCDLCDASFVRDDSLRSHKRQHRELSQALESTAMAVLQLQHPITNISLAMGTSTEQAPPDRQDQVLMSEMTEVDAANQNGVDDIRQTESPMLQNGTEINNTSQILQSALLQSDITPPANNHQSDLTQSAANLQTDLNPPTASNLQSDLNPSPTGNLQSGLNPSASNLQTNVHVGARNQISTSAAMQTNEASSTRNSLRVMSGLDQQAANLLAYAQNNRNRAVEENMQNAAISISHAAAAAANTNSQHNQTASSMAMQHNYAAPCTVSQFRPDPNSYSSAATISHQPLQQLNANESRNPEDRQNSHGGGVTGGGAPLVTVSQSQNHIGYVQHQQNDLRMDENSAAMQMVRISNQLAQSQIASSPATAPVPMEQQYTVTGVSPSATPQITTTNMPHTLFKPTNIQQGHVTGKTSEAQQQVTQHSQINVTHIYTNSATEPGKQPAPSSSSSHQHLIRQLQQPRIDSQPTKNETRTQSAMANTLTSPVFSHLQPVQVFTEGNSSQQSVQSCSGEVNPSQQSTVHGLTAEIPSSQAAMYTHQQTAAHLVQLPPSNPAILSALQANQTVAPYIQPASSHAPVTSNAQQQLTLQMDTSGQNSSGGTAQSSLAAAETLSQLDSSQTAGQQTMQSLQFFLPASDTTVAGGIQFAQANIGGQNVLIQVVTPQSYNEQVTLPHHMVQDLLKAISKDKHEAAPDNNIVQEVIGLSQPITTVDVSQIANHPQTSSEHH